MISSKTTPANTATDSQRSLLWQPARWFLAILGGILFGSLFSFFLNDADINQFALFLRGQVGFDAVTMPWFWKVGFGFALGCAGGFFVFLEIPKFYYEKANQMALVITLFLVPLLTYIPAMSAGFLWDDDQEIQLNPSIVLQFDAHQRKFYTNWRGLWEIWTGGITNERESEKGRAELGKSPAPWIVRMLRPPLCAIERELFGGANKEQYLFQGNQFADYFPVKSTTLWIEYQLWGYHIDPKKGAVTDAPPFHIMTIIFHAINCLLLWGVLRQLKVPGAWLGALLFGIHPVHAESVAWIAERKNTLSLLFALLSMRYWLKYNQGGTRRQYAAALALFVTSLLCKTHLVVFPAVLMLTEWWKTGVIPMLTPLYRLACGLDKNNDARSALKRDLWRYIPFFIVAAWLSVMTVWFQNDRAIGGEVIPIGDWASRLAGASVVSWSYLSKALLPINLNTIYANTGWLWWPLTNPQPWMFFAGAMILVTLLALLHIKKLVRFRTPVGERTPFYVFACFLGLLTPVLGFFTMSYMRLTLQADHFQYFSDISIVAAVGALIAIAYEKLGKPYRQLLVCGCIAAMVACCMYSWQRAGVHQSEETLWTACLKKNSESWQAHNHMGAVFFHQANEAFRQGMKNEGEKKIAAAGYHFTRAMELKPENPEVHNNVGLIHWFYKRYDQAIAEYREAVRIKRDVVVLRRNLADSYVMLRRYNEALNEYDIMIKSVPNDSNLHAMRGTLLVEMGRFHEARQALQNALALNPNNLSAQKAMEQLKRKGL